MEGEPNGGGAILLACEKSQAVACSEAENFRVGGTVSGGDEQLREAIRDALAKVPSDYAGAMRRYEEVSHQFFAELARSVEPLINAELAGRDSDDLESKRALATDLNLQLSRLRLSITCPRTGRAAILIGNRHDADDSIGRFQFEVRGHDGSTVRSCSSATLSHLRFQEQPFRLEPLARKARGREVGDG